MPPLGEVPITTFFKPAPKKRQRTTDSTLPLKKRKGDQSNACDGRSSVVQSAHTPNVPRLMNSQSSQDGGDIFPHFKTTIINEAQPRARKATDTRPGLSPNSFFPTPVTMKSDISRHLLVCDEETPPILNTLKDRTLIVSELDNTDQHVPSSQSQNTPDFFPIVSSDFRSTLPERKPSLPHSASALPWMDDNLEGFASDDAQLFISSSQSLPVDPSSDEQRPTSEFCHPGMSLVADFVPSSQSQESELILPHIQFETRQEKFPTLSRHSPCKTSNMSDMIFSRTFFDDLFMTPKQNSESDDICREEGPCGSEQKYLISAKHDLSVTESESENEVAGPQGANSDQLSVGSLPEALVCSWPCSPHEPPCGISTEDISTESLPQTVQPVSKSPEVYTESVPPAVRDFQNMFGSNDESYPPDFPMSLRM